MTDRLFLPWDGTAESLRAIQALAPGAYLIDDPAVADAPLLAFRGTSLTAFPGDVVTVDQGTGAVDVLERDVVDE